MTDDKSERPEAERPGDMFRRLGGLLGQATDLVKQVGKLQGKDGKSPVIETHSSMRTLDGARLDLETLVGALRGATEPVPEDKSRPLRQITPEFVTDTPERLVATGKGAWVRCADWCCCGPWKGCISVHPGKPRNNLRWKSTCDASRPLNACHHRGRVLT